MPRDDDGPRLRGARIRALSVAARAASRTLHLLPAGDHARRFLLERTWAHLPPEMLDAYLVSGYQNPRINVQSILIRHELIRRLLGDGFEALMDAEIRLAVELNEVLRVRARELGVTMGTFIDPEKHAQVRRVDAAIEGRDEVFVARWADLLAGRQVRPLSVLEVACGSANDYRAFVDYGIARLIDYRGVDLTEKNIVNARRRFPDARFEVGDATRLPYADGTFDCVIASDLFEHLPPETIDRALDEASRLARGAVVLSFFNMADIPEHLIRPKGAYHWNRLSRARVEARLRRRFPSVRTIPIGKWLAERYSSTWTYNRNAWTVIADRPDC